MKLLKSVLLIIAIQATSAQAVDLNADPNMTGAAPLPSIISGQSQRSYNDSQFDDTPTGDPGGDEPHVWCAALYFGLCGG